MVSPNHTTAYPTYAGAYTGLGGSSYLAKSLLASNHPSGTFVSAVRPIAQIPVAQTSVYPGQSFSGSNGLPHQSQPPFVPSAALIPMLVPTGLPAPPPWASGPAQPTAKTPVETAPKAPLNASVDAHATTSPGKGKRFRHGLNALLLFSGALLLNALPARPALAGLISSNWRSWAKVGLGITTVQQANQAIGLPHPPAWAVAAETSLVLHPLMMGIGALSRGHFALMAPLLAAVVQITQRLNQTVDHQLHERLGQRLTPRQQEGAAFLAKLGMMAATATAAVMAYPALYVFAGKSAILGHTVYKDALQKEMLQKSGATAWSILGAEAAGFTCANGCCVGSVFCMSDVADVLGSLWGTLWNRKPASTGQTPGQLPNPAHFPQKGGQLA